MTKQQWIGFPTADVAVGLFPGLPFGLAHVGAVDVLVNLAYIPKVSAGNYDLVTPNGSFQSGVRARIGVVNEGSARYQRLRSRYCAAICQTIGLAGSGLTTSQGDSLLHRYALPPHNPAKRFTAGKHAGILGAVVGVGKDHYSSSADLHAVVAPRGLLTSSTPTGNLAITQSVDRTNFSNT